MQFVTCVITMEVGITPEAGRIELSWKCRSGDGMMTKRAARETARDLGNVATGRVLPCTEGRTSLWLS